MSVSEQNAGSREMVQKVVLDQWDGYRNQVVPKDAGETQIEECYRAFIAGAATQAAFMLSVASRGMDAVQDLAEEIGSDSPNAAKRAHGEEV